MNIEELITDWKKDVNVIFDDIIPYSQNYKKMSIYNGDISGVQRIWIRTPQFKIFRSVYIPKDGSKKSINMQVIINDERFERFISKLERQVRLHIRRKMKKKLRSESSIQVKENFPPIMSLKMPFFRVDSCYEFSLHIYGPDNKRANVNSIKSGTYAASYIELTDIWIGDDKFGYNWNIFQLKLYPEIDFSQCLFTDAPMNIKKEDRNNECFHCLYCPNAHVRTHYCVNSAPIPTMMVPIPKPPPMITNHQPFNKSSFVPTKSDLLSVQLRPIQKKK